MGMPISCYWSLVALVRHGDRVGGWVKQLRTSFSRFAFVIHDPATHREFDDALNKSFDNLDYATGQRLLFFALVRPESVDVARISHRRYYKLLQEQMRQAPKGGWEMQQLGSPSAIPPSTDPSLSAWAFANALGIPYDELPCIVTTSDLLSRDVEVHRTNPDTLLQQLLELGKAESRRDKTHDDVLHQGTFFPGDECERSVKRLTRSLAATLSTVLGATYASDFGDHRNAESKKMYREAFLASLRDLLIDLRNARRMIQVDEDLSEEAQHLALTIAGVLQALAPRGPLLPPSPLGDPPQGIFENETRIMIKTAMRCLYVLTERPWLEWNGGFLSSAEEASNETDFTPSLIPLAKAFENEMNLSVVHWVRQTLGVSLPAHFNKMQRGVVAKFTPSSVRDGRPIDFNSGRGDQWLPPSIGQSELACKELAGVHLPHPFDAETWHLLMKAWQAIRTRRNVAAHHGLVTRDECETMAAQMIVLLEARVFHSTSTLKTLFRGGRD